MSVATNEIRCVSLIATIVISFSILVKQIVHQDCTRPHVLRDVRMWSNELSNNVGSTILQLGEIATIAGKKMKKHIKTLHLKYYIANHHGIRMLNAGAHAATKWCEHTHTPLNIHRNLKSIAAPTTTTTTAAAAALAAVVVWSGFRVFCLSGCSALVAIKTNLISTERAYCCVCFETCSLWFCVCLPVSERFNVWCLNGQYIYMSSYEFI